MEITPSGTPPLTTEGAQVPATETAEVLKARLVIAEQERDTFKAEALRANRAVEAGKKFEKFEEFQTHVMTQLDTLSKAQPDFTPLKKEIEDLKTIITNQGSITPNYGSVPSTPEEIQKTTEEENRTRQILGLPPITK